MLKFFWRTAQADPRLHDLLDHPVIRAMSLDQLADLPLTPRWPHGMHRASSPPPAGEC